VYHLPPDRVFRILNGVNLGDSGGQQAAAMPLPSTALTLAPGSFKARAQALRCCCNSLPLGRHSLQT
jgi:hypothetical protein